MESVILMGAEGQTKLGTQIWEFQKFQKFQSNEMEQNRAERYNVAENVVL